MKPIEADVKAADEAFLERIKEHALNDAKNIASPDVRAKLRSAKFAIDWNSTLGILASLVRDADLKRSINARRIEAATVVRKHRKASEEDTVSLHRHVEKEAGIQLQGGDTLQVIHLKLLVEILKELRK